MISDLLGQYLIISLSLSLSLSPLLFFFFFTTLQWYTLRLFFSIFYVMSNSTCSRPFESMLTLYFQHASFQFTEKIFSFHERIFSHVYFLNHVFGLTTGFRDLVAVWRLIFGQKFPGAYKCVRHIRIAMQNWL